jgi:hypothetical protein
MIDSSTLFILPQDKDMPLFFSNLIKEICGNKPNLISKIAQNSIIKIGKYKPSN